jgi:hypothetical protein
VTQSNSSVESINDSVDNCRRRANRASLARTLDTKRMGAGAWRKVKKFI